MSGVVVSAALAGALPVLRAPPERVRPPSPEVILVFNMDVKTMRL
jgi:hypothetical protein